MPVRIESCGAGLPAKNYIECGVSIMEFGVKIKSLPVFVRAKNLIFIVLMSLSISVFAIGNSTGPVTVPLLGAINGVFYFKAGTPASQPSCVTILGQPWVLNLKTDGGKAAYAMLLSAMAQGKTVTIYGNGTCDLWGDRETVDAVFIN